MSLSIPAVMNADGALGHASGSVITGGEFVITSVPSVKVRAVGAGVHVGPLSYTFAGGSSAGFDSGSIATLVPQVIPATATKTAVESAPPMRLGDGATMAASGTVGGTPTPISGDVEVANAGQDRVGAQ